MRKALIILTLGFVVLTLSACETMKGFGKDMEDAGEWVQKKAQ
jgi:predicted small secreted protein